LQLAIYDWTDNLFSHVVEVAARRRDHTAKQIANIGEIESLFATPPTAVIMGAATLDEVALSNVQKFRKLCADALILVVAEDVSARAVISAREHGADDVTRKPVLPHDLVLLVETAVANRPVQDQRDGTIRISDLEIDLDRALAMKAGQSLTLTRMELRLLYCLAQHRGRVTPTDRLHAFAWESDELAVSSLKTHISHLRQKLREAGGHPVTIKARQMLGYILEIEEPS